jgi:hypothetical protein
MINLSRSFCKNKIKQSHFNNILINMKNIAYITIVLILVLTFVSA